MRKAYLFLMLAILSYNAWIEVAIRMNPSDRVAEWTSICLCILGGLFLVAFGFYFKIARMVAARKLSYIATTGG